MAPTAISSYSYDSHRDFEFKGEYAHYVLRLSGLVFLILSIKDFFFTDNQSTLGYVLATLFAVSGLMYLFAPRSVFRPWKKHATFINLEDGKLSWNLNGRNKVKELEVSEIESVHQSVGDAVINMKSGETHNIQVHKIHNKKKHEDFVNLLKSLDPN